MYLSILLIICYTLPPLLRACPIYLTISLDGETVQDSHIEVNWGPECNEHPEWIGIFREDPSITYMSPEARITNITNSSGKVVSDVKIGQLKFPQGWNRYDENDVPIEYPKGKCLPYYVASFNGTELLTVECLKIQPNWMSRLEHIAQMPLKELFIPGTHASAAYAANLTKSFEIDDYIITQQFDVWSQLVFGIRYLDFRIDYNECDDSNNTDKFYIVNEDKPMRPLRSVLRDIKRFVQLSNEVVILEFVPIGFFDHSERHISLSHLLREEVGDIVYIRNTSTQEGSKPCYELTIEEIRKDNKNLIILYPIHNLPDSESKMLCPGWTLYSTIFSSTSKALYHMRNHFSQNHNEGWIYQARRSKKPSLTAKEHAAALNPEVTSWLMSHGSSYANVVAFIYFSNTNLIDLAINSNMHKAFNMTIKNFVHFEIVNV